MRTECVDLMQNPADTQSEAIKDHEHECESEAIKDLGHECVLWPRL